MTAFVDAAWAWALDALQVLGPLVTLGLVLWARSVIAKLSAKSATAEAEIQASLSPMTNDEKRAVAHDLMRTVPMLFRATAKTIGKRVDAAVRDRKDARSSAPPPAGDEP